MDVTTMKRCCSFLILFLFGIGLLFLADQLFPGLRQRVIAVVQHNKLHDESISLPLGQVEVIDYRRMGFTSAFLRFSADNRHLAIGTELGEIVVVDSNGKKCWQQQLGSAKITALEFSADGTRLYVGESSPAGLLRAINAQTGATEWERSCAVELGVDLKQKSLPAVIDIASDDADRIYAVAQRYIRKSNGSNQYLGRIYQFDVTGRDSAQFPADHNLDTWVGCIAVDSAGRSAAIATANYDSQQRPAYCDQLYLLNERLTNSAGRQIKIEPIEPYSNVTLRKSPALSPDGRYIASIATDGRAFLHDSSGREVWCRQLSSPTQVGGVYINATGLYLKLAPNRLAFSTGNTYNRANWQLPTPVEHPSSNSLFLFDYGGTFIARYSAGGMIEQLNGNTETAALAIGRNIWTKDPAVHGLALVSLENGRELRRFATTGPCVAAALSTDGSLAAAVEAPIKLDNGEIIGDYRLHIWKLK